MPELLGMKIAQSLLLGILDVDSVPGLICKMLQKASPLVVDWNAVVKEIS